MNQGEKDPEEISFTNLANEENLIQENNSSIMIEMIDNQSSSNSNSDEFNENEEDLNQTQNSNNDPTQDLTHKKNIFENFKEKFEKLKKLLNQKNFYPYFGFF